MLLFLLLLLPVISQTFTIDKQVQLDALAGSTLINSSLIILGNNITNLYSLSKANTIDGYLMILQTSNLQSLAGLENIKNINGRFSENSSVYISGNSKLCYVNTINWGLVTSYDVAIDNNMIECQCDNQCVGCFGAGNRMCQRCLNFSLNNACVNMCPEGTLTNNYTKSCEEINVPGQSIISYTFDTILTFTWTDPNPNGIITAQKLYIDGVLVLETELSYDKVELANQYMYNATVNSVINVTLFSRNSIGWNGTNSNIIVAVTPNDEDNGTFISNLNIYVKIGVIAGIICFAVLLTVLIIKYCDNRSKKKVNPRDFSNI